ncbi:MAG: ABC transporter permease [Syntrophales bacterium]|nr:ABC transporter permease [Syntrophales bacterium]
MKMLILLSFRNILRNRRRTALTVLLIGCGLATLILYDGLVRGISKALVKEATGTFLGEAQIHREGFRNEREIDLVVARWPEVEKTLREDRTLAAYAPRVVATGMISSPRNVSAVAINGIDPEREPRVSKVRQALRQGQYLTGTSETEILIGWQLAQILEVEVGDRVVLTAAEAGGGDLAQELFRVSGIVRFNSRPMDQGMVFIPLHRAQRMLHLNGDVHEVALRFKKLEDADNRTLPLWKDVSRGGNEALAWRELVPQVQAILEMSSYGTLISGTILVAVIILSVINSMLMSIYERLFEFGVLKAIGTRPKEIALMILLEAMALAIISSVVGIVTGAAISGWFSQRGFDFAGMEYAGTTLTDPIRTILAPEQFILFPIFVIILTVMAGIYPAIHAARLVPSEAMRKSL